MKQILLSLITIFAITTISAQNIKENKTEETETSISTHLSNMTAVVVNREINNLLNITYPKKIYFKWHRSIFLPQKAPQVNN